MLGVHIISAGCKKVEIKPNLGNLSRVKGTYPTPYGIISVECKRLENGKIHTKWTAPEEIEVISEKKGVNMIEFDRDKDIFYLTPKAPPMQCKCRMVRYQL